MSDFEPLYTAEEMRAAEAAYEGPTADLMERAGTAAAELVLQRFPDAKRITVWCGAGANGGDGFVIARLLRKAGRDRRNLEKEVVAEVGDANVILIPQVQPVDQAITGPITEAHAESAARRREKLFIPWNGHAPGAPCTMSAWGQARIRRRRRRSLHPPPLPRIVSTPAPPSMWFAASLPLIMSPWRVPIAFSSVMS